MDCREPYSYDVVESSLLGWPKCHIIFDGTVVRELTMPIAAVKEMVNVLNCAYAVGYMEGQAGL